MSRANYLMVLDEEELEVIYLLIENDDNRGWEIAQEDAIKRIITKVCANKIGMGAHPTGAIGTVYDEIKKLVDS